MLKLHQKPVCIITVMYHHSKNLLNVETMEYNISISSFFFNDIKCIHQKTKEKLKVVNPIQDGPFWRWSPMGGRPKKPLPNYNDEIWHSYTLLKEDPEKN